MESKRIAKRGQKRPQPNEESDKPVKSKRRAGSPNLRTARRAAYHDAPEAETFNRNFKARPMPTMSRSRATSSSTVKRVSQTTKQEPFSFDNRVSKNKMALKPKSVMQRQRSHSAGALPVSLDKPEGLSKRHTRTKTKTEPFSFATAARIPGKNTFIQDPKFKFGKAKHSSISTAKVSTVPKTVSLPFLDLKN